MKTYKFRARDLDTGRFVYGHFIVEACGLSAIITTCPAATYEVDPDSVAQLVGYDKDGREIYEGDTVIVDDETLDGTAKISPEITFGNGFGRFVNETTQKSITLKE